MENNTYVKIASVLTAILIWIVVGISIYPSTSRALDGVPVNMDLQSTAYTSLGLDLIEFSHETVSVTVEGNRLDISALSPEQLTATAVLTSEVTEPNTYTLRLSPAYLTVDGASITRISYSPAVIQVKFDRLVEKTLTITHVIHGMSIAPEFIQGKQSINPSTVTITGPQAEVDKIEQAVVEVELDDPLERTAAFDLPVQLLDEQGLEVIPGENYLNTSTEEARLIIEMLKETGLPLEVRFTNIPNNFPIDDLTYTMSDDYVEVAGPVDVIGRDKEIVLGYIDVREISLDRNSFTFSVNLPTEYQNLDNITSVRVEFDDANWNDASFTVDSDNFQLLNIPDNYEVSVMTDTMDLLMVGNQEIIEEMSADDIVVEINLSERDLAEGQTQFPIKISVPSKGLVWATGEYTVVINVEPKED